ncbi:DUF1302 domain-containing protein [Thalassotalea psychrophila]|uniref:DUF1302 domain-containing protein n=1 Tax=Thalassotalea psychrophila TaxID=3065647 RepID=A0ABY9U080_9GAMM|nr:DUF1302 domain-containing protein [Colwelliaceae bacterium SQ149]
MQNVIKKCALATAITVGLCANSVHATSFYFGENDDIELHVNNKISIGISKRMEKRDNDFVYQGNGGNAFSSTTDDGNLNYDDGDTVSQIIKGLTEVELTRDNIGAVLKVKYWYDYQLKDKEVNHGHINNGLVPDSKLNDDGFDDFAKFSGIELLDAYVWGQFDLGEMPIDVRLGRQVLSWGESTFIQGGLSSINPFDVSAFRRPGAELKEGLLPVGMVYMNLGMTDNLSLEAFYQYEWEKTQIDGCGTFFSNNDFAGTGCNGITVGPFDDETAYQVGLVAPRYTDVKPEDDGQYGVALRYVAPELNDTEFGLYYFNIHSRLPLINAQRSATNSIAPGAPVFVPESMDPTGGALSALNPGYMAVFPEDLEYFGATFATNLGGVALSGEVSYKPDTPVQISGPEVLNAALSENPLFAFTPEMTSAEYGESVDGWNEFDVTQVQMTAIKFIDQILGASRVTLIAEAGVVLTDNIEEEIIGYGRPSGFGLGDQYVDTLHAVIPPLAGMSCADTYEAAGIGGDCSSDGFTTDTAWGYRIRAVFDYPNVFAGVSLKPTIAWSHDVSGYAPEPAAAFVEDRKSLGLSVNALYKSIYSLDIGYTVNTGGDYNLNSDKDFMSASFSVSF